jgi:hypothetical protein
MHCLIRIAVALLSAKAKLGPILRTRDTTPAL